MLAVVVLSVAFLGSGCQDSGSIDNQDNQSTQASFRLEDTHGLVRTSFAATDTVVFVYALHNPRITERQFYIGHGGSWVRFLIRHDALTLEDSYSGAIFPAVVVNGTIGGGKTIEARWMLALGQTSRVPGTYVVAADPQISLDGAETLPDLASAITIR
jgi:hypothetical protein